MIALALVRVGSWIEGTLVAGLLLLLGLQTDSWGSLVCVSAAVVGVRNTHSGWLRAMSLALLATLSLTKFTLLPQAWLAALAICATPLATRSWWSAAVRALFFMGAVAFAPPPPLLLALLLLLSSTLSSVSSPESCSFLIFLALPFFRFLGDAASSSSSSS